MTAARPGGLLSAWYWTESQATWKWLAILSMLVDHIGVVLFPENPAYRFVGRLAFPVFVILVSINLGFREKDPTRYFRTLALFTVVSQLPYMLAFTGVYRLNIMLTLLLGIIVVAVVQKRVSHWWLLTLVLSPFVDYGVLGVSAVPLFTLGFQKSNWSYFALGILALSLSNGVWGIFVLPVVVLAVLFWSLPGALPRGPKLFFYIFYPAHLAGLALLAYLLGP